MLYHIPNQNISSAYKGGERHKCRIKVLNYNVGNQLQMHVIQKNESLNIQEIMYGSYLNLVCMFVC